MEGPLRRYRLIERIPLSHRAGRKGRRGKLPESYDEIEDARLLVEPLARDDL